MSILNARIGQSIGFMVAAIILAIAATVLAFIFIVPEKKREKLNAFGKFLHDTCNFKYLVVEKLLQALYIFLTAYFILQGFFMLFQTSYGTWLGGAGLAIMIISPIVLRLVYELLMMAVILVKNVIMINKKLKDQNGNGNIENVLEAGCDGALTGPIERNDIETVKKHIACMQNDDSDDVSLYKMLGTKLANIAEKKNPDKDYTQMMELLRG